MSEKTSAEVVAEMQRRLDSVEMALWNLCHLKSRVEFFVKRRDSENLYCARIAGHGDEEIHSADRRELLAAVGDRAFMAHVERCERANAQR